VWVVTVPLAAQANLYCTDDDIRGLMSALGLDARLDDDDSKDVDTGESAFLLQARNYATAKCKLYGQPHYNDEELASSWLVNEWAVLWAAEWVCSRRMNEVPAPVLRLLYGGEGEGKGALGDMKDVRAGVARLPDVGRRNVDWPFWSNVTVDPRYRVKQIRVQRPVSEKTVPQYPQNVDRVADALLEP